MISHSSIIYQKYNELMVSKVKNMKNKIYMSGYIPPELDPEYRNGIIKSRAPIISINTNIYINI